MQDMYRPDPKYNALSEFTRGLIDIATKKSPAPHAEPCESTDGMWHYAAGVAMEEAAFDVKTGGVSPSAAELMHTLSEAIADKLKGAEKYHGLTVTSGLDQSGHLGATLWVLATVWVPLTPNVASKL